MWFVDDDDDDDDDDDGDGDGEGWILCSTLGLTSGGREETREVKDNVYLGPPLYWMDLALSLSHWICRLLLGVHEVKNELLLHLL